MQLPPLIELASRDASHISSAETLVAAAAMLAQQRGEWLLGLQENKPSGVLSAHDLLDLYARGIEPSTNLSAYWHPLPVLPPSASWAEAHASLTEADSCGVLAILDDSGELAGILTEETLCNYLGMHHLSRGQSLFTQLRDSELKLKAIFNSTQILLGLLDPAGKLLDVNDAALDLIDATRDQSIGLPFWQTSWWAHDPRLQEQIRQAVSESSQGRTVRFETSHIDNEGRRRVIDFCMRPICDETGKVCFLLPEGRDVSDYRQVEASLGSERAVLRAVLDTIPDLIFYKDTECTYLGCNKAFEKYYGKPESQITGRTDFYFVGNETAEAYRSADREVMTTGELRKIEEWASYPDGKQVLLETIKVPIRDEQGRVSGMLGISRDITESRNSEIALRASDARYRQLFENMTSGFALHEVVLDMTGKPVDYRFLEVNPAFEKILGISAEQLIGRTVREILPNVEDYWIDTYGGIAMTGKAVSQENYLASLERWFSVQAFCPERGQFAAITNDVTARRQAEDLLRQQKAQLRAILDNFPFFVWMKDRDGRYLAANFEMARLCGCTNPDEMLGKTDRDFWSAGMAAHYRANDLLVMETLERQMIEEPEGDTDRWVETFKTPILDDTGALLGTVGFARDITERKQAEEALLASRAHYQALLDASPVGVIELDAMGGCVYVNPRYTEITGLSQAEARGRGWYKGVYPQDLPIVFQAMDRASGQGVNGLEYRHIRPDGECIWMFSQGATMHGRDGKISGAIVTLTDITKRKEAENQLKLAASMFAASSEGIMVADADNHIVSVNPAFTSLLGYSPAEVLGTDPRELHARDNSPALYQSLWQAVDEAGHWQGEVWFQRKGGTNVAVWMTVNTLRNRKGEVQWRFALFTDVTERKRSEELIWHQANYDVLTGLPNRRLFRDRLLQEIRRAERSNHVMALFFIDLDRFKEVNDTLGHDCGDKLLIQAGERISNCVRRSDSVARLGGDEFTVLLPELPDKLRTQEVALAIIQVLASPFLLDSGEASISASIGIAYYPDDGGSDLELLKQADRAMYFAKAKGRNCFAGTEG